MPDRPYGRIAGLAERLDYWIERLSEDKSLPWIGLGVIDDLKAARRYMEGERTDSVEVEELEWDL